MIYFRVKENKIEKYEVIYDKVKMMDLKDEILYKCSELVYQEFESDYEPNIDYRKVINFNSKKIGKKEYFEETRDVYRYSYYEYIPPYLYEILSRIIYNESEENKLFAVKELFAKNLEETEKPVLDEKIEALTNLFNNEKDTSIKIKYTQELNKLLELKKKSSKVKPVKEYYDKARELIDFKLIDTMKISDVDRVVTFFNKSIDVTFEKEDLLEIKKQLIK